MTERKIITDELDEKLEATKDEERVSLIHTSHNPGAYPIRKVIILNHREKQEVMDFWK